MSRQSGKTSILLVTGSEKTSEAINKLLSRSRYSPILTVKSAGEARRIMMDSPYDIVIIRPPMPDDLGIRLGEDLLRYETSGVLLLVGGEQYDQLAWQAEESGVMVLPRPVDGQTLLQTLSLLTSMINRLRKLEDRAENLQVRMDEIRVINRAKMLLIEHRAMTEPESHRYIEKTAMDRCQKRREIAARIIAHYENDDRPAI